MNTSQFWYGTAESGDLGDTIDNSLRFHNGNTVLHRAQESTTINDDKNFTFATWFKIGFIGEQNIFGFHNQNPENWILRWTTTHNTFGTRHSTNGTTHWGTDPEHRDNNGWYHLLVQCTNGALDLYVNGVKNGGQISASHHSSGFDRNICIGAENTSGGSSMQGYLADTYFIQGDQLHPINDNFVRFNDDGVLVPDTPSISSWGSNGFHLDYKDASDPGKDVSGQGHHFTAVGFDTAAISASNESNDTGHVDTPTQLYAQYNRLAMHSSQTTSQANLQTSATAYNYAPATIGIPADCGKKFYWEVTTRNTSGNVTMGMCDPSQRLGQSPAHGWVFCPPLEDIESDQGNISDLVDTSVSTINTASGTTYMFAYDADTQNVWIGDSGSWYKRDGAAGVGNPGAGTNAFLSTSDNCIVDGATYAPATAGSSGGTTAYEINFGQMDFVHTVPDGFVHLNGNNFPRATITDGKDHFGILTYQAPGSPSYPITIDGSGGNNGDGDLDFGAKPDLVWIKMRNAAQNHTVFDSLRGNTKSLRPDENGGEANRSNFDFVTDGIKFTGADAETYQQNDQYVAWCWKAGGAPTATNDNDPGTQQDANSVMVNGTPCDGTKGGFAHGTIRAKKMSVNTKAGFSIVQYEGTGSAGSIPHGLGKIPKFGIFKRHDGDANWDCYHVSVGNKKVVKIDLADEQSADGVAYWNNLTPTDEIFTIGAGGANNTDNEDMIAYIWTDIEGFSKFGEYTGNGSADGNFVYLGFKPRLVVIKRIEGGGGGSWFAFDSARETTNTMYKEFHWDTAAIENTANQDEDKIDFCANGFKLRSNRVNYNASDRFLYLAWAENPFVGENVPPTTAR